MPRELDIETEKFKNIDLEDPFFDSLKEGYAEFENWFHRKSEESSYVMYDDFGKVQAFLYLKEEHGEVTDTTPSLPADHYLKVGTFKINAHGSKLGERFVKKIFDHALHKGVKKIYVTVFSTHASLIALLEKYGFVNKASKTTDNGTEVVLVKDLSNNSGDLLKDYPLVRTDGRLHLLAIYPDYHTRLFPDSILNNEDARIVDDISHTNSIQKIYICKMARVGSLNSGDSLIIYRTSDRVGQAQYRSVATSLCMVEEVKKKSDFADLSDFLNYCASRSVFPVSELTEMYNESKLYIIKLTYNLALNKRIIRKTLLDDVGLPARSYWGIMELTESQFKDIAERGEIDDSLIVN